MTFVHRQETVNFTVEQMYALISNYEEYKNFMHNIVKVQIHSKTETSEIAETFIKAPMGTISFSNKVNFIPHERIEMQHRRGLFNTFKGYWGFTKLDDTSCQIELKLNFSLPFHLLLFTPFIKENLESMLDSFIKEAHRKFN